MRVWAHAALALAVLLAACEQGAVSQNGKLRSEPEPAAVPATAGLVQQVTFIDSLTFDTQLGDRLRSEVPEVIVVPASPVTVNAIPERLDKWFHAVESSGGKVRLKALPPKSGRNSRAIFGFILDFVIATYELIFETIKYESADRYDVILLYRPDTGDLESAVFTLRSL
jgi:hypothetical protein